MMTESDLWKCKYVNGGEDKDGFLIPCCSISGLPCMEVLQYADEACKYRE